MLAWRLKLLDSANAVSTGTAASVFRLVKEENMMRYVRARILLQVGSFVALMVLIAVETEVCSCQVVEGIVETWIGLTRKVGITGRYRHLKVNAYGRFTYGASPVDIPFTRFGIFSERKLEDELVFLWLLPASHIASMKGSYVGLVQAAIWSSRYPLSVAMAGVKAEDW